MRRADAPHHPLEAACLCRREAGCSIRASTVAATLNLTESTVTNNYVDSSFTGSTTSGLGGALPATHLNMPAGGAKQLILP